MPFILEDEKALELQDKKSVVDTVQVSPYHGSTTGTIVPPNCGM